MTKIFIASDHGGFALKEKLKPCLRDLGVEVIDGGMHELEDASKSHYPIYGKAGAKAVLNKEADFAVLVCGSGIGMAMAANRFRGIRAAVIATPDAAKLTRAHNDANVLCLAGRFLSVGKAKKIVKAFLSEPFAGEQRYLCRRNMLDED